ncbi:MAG: flagellar hook-length control protein FliK [Candidatus Scalindua sp.]
MSDKSINSLPGMLSTKELPASGKLKTTNYSLNENYDKNNFHSKLMNSVEKRENTGKQASTDILSESNSTKYTQKSDERTATDIPSEPNSIKDTQTPDEQTATNIPSESVNIKDTDDINHIRELLSVGIKTIQTANTDGNQTQLKPEVNQNINENEFTNAIINKISNNKISTARIETNTLLENPLLKNQELKPLSVPNANIAQKQTVDSIQEPVASLSGKLNSTQVTTNTTQQIPGDIEQEPLQTSLSDKLNTTQSNTKMGEQRILDIINSPGMSEAATESKGDESMLHLSKLSSRQTTASSDNNLNKDQNKPNITSAQNNVPAIEKVVSNNKIIDLNTSSHSDESTNNKENEMLKGQQQNKAVSPYADKNLQTQQSLAQAQIESEETPKIFETNANATEPKAAKLFDNTTLTSNSSVNTVEAAMQSNASSDNSAFSNQGTDTDYNFSSNSVNNSQKIKTETNFNSTLSQINNSAKPLGTLGNDVADNIIQNAKLYTQGGKSEIKVLLSPPELGTIKLEFRIEDDVLETKITVERSSIKDIIEKDIPRLRELLSNADIDVGKLDVSLQDKENRKMDFMNKEFQSDSKSKGTQNLSQQESEYHEDNLDEEVTSSNSESTRINYLV